MSHKQNFSLSIVIPCFNEERQVEKVVKTIPSWIDNIVIVEDKSEDGTKKIVQRLAKKRKVVGIYHQVKIPYQKDIPVQSFAK